MFFFFFFQAEDGIRDSSVTGVQTCALPISADDYQTFNGYCGAESGFVPVSATSPSLLVEQIEVERRDKGNDKPPALPAPTIRGGRWRGPPRRGAQRHRCGGCGDTAHPPARLTLLTHSLAP